ncbi:MAG: hypothetical protein J4432_00815 [DPANN group archaeon]|nr:hypothetical protein [DPANN group archaeon]
MWRVSELDEHQGYAGFAIGRPREPVIVHAGTGQGRSLEAQVRVIDRHGDRTAIVKVNGVFLEVKPVFDNSLVRDLEAHVRDNPRSINFG